MRAWIDLLKMLNEWIITTAEKITNVFIKAIDSAISRLKELWQWAQKVGADISGTVSNAGHTPASAEMLSPE